MEEEVAKWRNELLSTGRGLSVFREGGLVKEWLAKLAALYFKSRHPSTFLMGNISKGVAKRTKINKK